MFLMRFTVTENNVTSMMVRSVIFLFSAFCAARKREHFATNGQSSDAFLCYTINQDSSSCQLAAFGEEHCTVESTSVLFVLQCSTW